jgi:hypothetical protein
MLRLLLTAREIEIDGRVSEGIRGVIDEIDKADAVLERQLGRRLRRIDAT